MYIDAHCHLTHPNMAGALAACKAKGISGWVLASATPEDWDQQDKLKAEHPGAIQTAYGLHPWWVATASQAEIDKALASLGTRLPQASALGEMGIDALRPNEPLQTEVFEKQLELAQEHDKPMILHVVRAHVAAVRLLNAYGPFAGGGILHAFSGDLNTAQAYINRGFLISIGSGVLKKGFETLKATVKELSPDNMVIETDAPDGIAADKLLEVAQAVGALQNRRPEDVLSVSTENLKGFFSWK